MFQPQVVILTHIYDQADLLPGFFAWYSQIGVELFMVQDMGSTDGSLELLDKLSKQYKIEWFSIKEKNLRKYRLGNTGDEMALMAIEKYDPKWIAMCDADEFLITENLSLHAVLDRAELGGVTSINIPCFNMTGPPLAPGADALATLNLRIAKPYIETQAEQISGDLSRPYVFIRHPQKSIVLAAAFSGYVAGSHGTHVAFGKTATFPGTRFNHYSIRGFDKFEQKIRNTEDFLRANDHLESWWAWHWRRWIRMAHLGTLKEDYDWQFVRREAAAELLADGTCVIDNVVADWARGQPWLTPPAPMPETASAVSNKAKTVGFPAGFVTVGALASPKLFDDSHCDEMAPFLFWLMETARPNLVLDVESHKGTAFSLFCQSIRANHLGTKCIKVEASETRPEISEGVDTVDKLKFESELTMYRECLDVRRDGLRLVLKGLPASSVDLLFAPASALDSLEESEFEFMLSRLSDRGVLLIRGEDALALDPVDVRVNARLSRRFPKFELSHGPGLTLFGIGGNLADSLQHLLSLPYAEAQILRVLYSRLGRGLPQSRRDIEGNVKELSLSVKSLERERNDLQSECVARDEIIRQLQAHIGQLSAGEQFLKQENKNLSAELQLLHEKAAERKRRHDARLARRVGRVVRSAISKTREMAATILR